LYPEQLLSEAGKERPEEMLVVALLVEECTETSLLAAVVGG
jgi:hypothetical protein